MILPVRFIVIDDDPVNNFLCSAIIEEAVSGAAIAVFEYPEKALAYIADTCSGVTQPTILFLDINMPTWSGWEFLEKFDQLDENVKDQVKVYLLSSSVDLGDKQRAFNNKYVIDYIEKPLSEEVVLSILEKQKEIPTGPIS